jgi:hypothetical protein
MNDLLVVCVADGYMLCCIWGLHLRRWTGRWWRPKSSLRWHRVDTVADLNDFEVQYFRYLFLGEPHSSDLRKQNLADKISPSGSASLPNWANVNHRHRNGCVQYSCEGKEGEGPVLEVLVESTPYGKN